MQINKLLWIIHKIANVVYEKTAYSLVRTFELT
jgi:hypothetical protein